MTDAPTAEEGATGADDISLDLNGDGDSRALLQEAVKGQDDEALTALAENLGGVEAFLELVFSGMTQAIDKDKAQDAVIGWEVVHGEQVHPYVLSIKGGEASAERGEPTDARVTLRMSLPNFMRLAAGELDGMQAFMSGGLQLKGDMMFAAQIQQMFGV